MGKDSIKVDHFRAKDIGLRTQKKLLGSMSNKTAVKMFIDDRIGLVLDNIYKLFKQYFGNKKEAEKVIKCIIKTTVKIGILHKNKQFNNEESEVAAKLPSCFQKVIMTVGSFHELDFSYDYLYLLRLLGDLHINLQFLIRRHLKEKSMARLNHVFHYITKKDFCDSLFLKDSPYYNLSEKIIFDLINIVHESG